MPMPWERDWGGATAGAATGGGALPWQRNWSGQVEELPAQTVQPDQNVKHGLSAFWDQINPLNVVNSLATAVSDPKATAKALYNAQADRLKQARDLWGQRRYTEAAGNALAGAIPLVGPAAAAIGDQMGGTDPKLDKYGNVIEPGRAPDPVGALGSGLGIIATTALAPKVTEYAGKAIRLPARPLVKSALRLPGKTEAYGANPALGVLRDTRGVRASTIARTGHESLAKLVPEMEAEVSSVRTPIDLNPPRDIVTSGWMQASKEGNVPLVKQIEEMGDALARNRATGQSYGNTLNPRDALDLKRGFGDEFATYNPNIHERANAIAKDVRANINQQIHTAAPRAASLDQRIQSLIPAVRNADLVAHQSGVIQGLLDDATRPTGALVGPLFGLEHGGWKGLLEVIGARRAAASPTAKMIGARGFYNTGGLLSAGATQRAAQLLPILGLLSDEYGSAGYNPQQ